MRIFKKSLILLLPLIILSFNGCFGGGDEETPQPETQNFSTYSGDGFSISMPKSWDTIEQKDFSSDIPKDTQVIFRNNLQSDKFTSNANVTNQKLSSTMSSYEFAKSQVQATKQNLQNYKEISRDEEFNIVVGGQMEKTILIMFEGKQSESNPLIRIVQVYAVNGTTGYTASGAYLKDAGDTEVETIKNIVKSFKLL